MSTLPSPSVQNICINKPHYTTQFLVGVISVQSKPNSVSLCVQAKSGGGILRQGDDTILLLRTFCLKFKHHGQSANWTA